VTIFLNQKFSVRKEICLFLFLLLTIVINAQQDEYKFNGEISGRVIDSTSGSPVEYVIISIVSQENGKIINGNTSDDKGFFHLTNVAKGTYKIITNSIDYQTIILNNIDVNKVNSNINLGDMRLTSKPTLLKEVTVTAEKHYIENKFDKMVYNAEKDITSQGGIATDILKKIPQVNVDVNGNVELQGNSNILFLINGKPSGIFGNNVADVLQSIPASQIQTIEIVTNPGAKYDAEGGGIINIILKKTTAQGISGNISLSGGSRLENGSVNLSGRKVNFGVNAFISGNAQLPSTTMNSLNRLSNDTIAIQTSRLLQNGSSNFKRSGYQSGINFDWAITPNDNITLSLTNNFFQNSNDGLINQQSIIQDLPGNTLSNIYTFNNTDNKFHSQSFDWNLDYKRKFKREGQELEILFTSSDGNNYSFYQQVQQLVPANLISSGTYGNNPGFDKQVNMAINYSQPLFKDAMVETGVKTTLGKVSSKSEVYLLNTTNGNYNFNSSQSTAIQYNRNIYAYYLSISYKLLGFLNVKTGCREEYTVSKANFSNSPDVNLMPYYSIVPSGVISHAIDKTQTIKISYSRRILRPNYRDLNPFINASDPKNIITGNPNLEPETSDQIEIGYNKNFEKGTNIYLALFYRANQQDIQSYTMYYPTLKIGDSTYLNVLMSMRKNMGLESNYGLNLFTSLPISKIINLRCNISGFQRYIITNLPDGNIQGFMYRINLIGSCQLTNTLSFELFGNFNSSKINAQGKMPAFIVYNFAIRQQLFHKKGSIAFTATNPFNKYLFQKTELAGNNFSTSNTIEIPYRSFGLNFTYKFGKIEFKKQKEVEDINLTNPPAQDN